MHDMLRIVGSHLLTDLYLYVCADALHTGSLSVAQRAAVSLRLARAPTPWLVARAEFVLKVQTYGERHECD